MCNIISKNIVNEQNNTGAKANQQIAKKSEMQESERERANEQAIDMDGGLVIIKCLAFSFNEPVKSTDTHTHTRKY